MSTSKSFSFTKSKLSILTTQAAKGDEYSDKQVIGLKIAVYASGAKSFLFRYSIGGKKKSIKIGSFPALTVDDARKFALEYRAMVDRAIDPQEAKAQVAAEPTLAEFAMATFMPFVEQYKRYPQGDESKLRLHVLPALGRKKLRAISKQDISTYHAAIRQSHSSSTANRHLSLLSKLFGLAVDFELLETNPCAGVKKFKEAQGSETFLSVAEFKAIFEAMTTDSNPVACAAIKILFLTGVRRQEALGAKWADVDLDKRTWFLPKTKSGVTRTVVLSDAAVTVFKARLADSKGSAYVFHGRDPSKALVDPKKTLLRLLAKAGIKKHFRIHDARHSYASLAVSNGVPLYTVQNLLGHASAQTTQRYAHLSNTAIRAGTELVSQLVA